MKFRLFDSSARDTCLVFTYAHVWYSINNALFRRHLVTLKEVLVFRFDEKIDALWNRGNTVAVSLCGKPRRFMECKDSVWVPTNVVPPMMVHGWLHHIVHYSQRYSALSSSRILRCHDRTRVRLLQLLGKDRATQFLTHA